MPFNQVAALLGYTEQSAFNRACKRWFATTPRQYRQCEAVADS
ncbi:helix-turn-helix domain-containing protein [Salinisphaera aquimarina]|uniref:Helix-turn-helix domain-containing protein n=1 Tax=Salinisphaera aquimarina TaxID=2094031 RepID=A0ABV7EHY9_9GAMM